METDFDNPTYYSSSVIWRDVEYDEYLLAKEWVTEEAYRELLAAYKELKFRMEEMITINLNYNTLKMSNYFRKNQDGSMTLINVTHEVTPEGVIVRRTESEGGTIRYE